MVNQAGFGIGCFAFEVPAADLPYPEHAGTYTAQAFEVDVRKALEAIPSVREVEIIGMGGFGWIAGRPPPPKVEAGDATRSHRGGPFVPHFYSGRIRFKIEVPERTQQSLFPSLGSGLGTLFTVDIIYTGNFPVTFIQPLALADGARPSSAVPIVREFIRAEFQRRVDQVGLVRFSCMGPSPMWVNCYVAPGTGLDGDPLGISYEWSPARRGYDTVRFSFDPDRFDCEAAFQEIVAQTVDELGLYYGLVSSDLELMHRRYELDNELGALTSLHSALGLVASARRLVVSGRMLRRLALSLVSAEREVTAACHDWDEDIERHYATDAIRPFRDKVLQRRSELQTPADQSMREVLRVLDLWHTRDVQGVTVLLAALAGGVGGAAVSALLG